ncbi:MAG TPA: hypothetical protein ENG70_01755 [Candidatus Cloacimonetes bacterium]|nr:hypothetical protein [Candidatus Cloacimonadota bacterium]HEX37575.1 hypothetical protein [Candidatus Cloacimonadota bacterium]
MNIKFKDINTGIVQARAVIEIAEGIFLNEITILRKGRETIVELPQKSFRGKDGKMYHMNILTFANEDKENLFKLEIKNEYLKWRGQNPKILVYENK